MNVGLPAKVPAKRPVWHLSAYADVCVPPVANAVNLIRRSLRFRESRRESEIPDVPLQQERVLLLAEQLHREAGTLGTSDKRDAQRLLHAKNESYCTPRNGTRRRTAYALAAIVHAVFANAVQQAVGTLRMLDRRSAAKRV